MEPLYLVSAGILFGCLLGAYGDLGPGTMWAIAMPSLAGCAFGRLRAVSIVLVFLSVGGLRAEQCRLELAASPISRFPDKGVKTELVGTVCAFPEKTRNGTRLVLERISVGAAGRSCSGKIMATADVPTTRIGIGEIVSLTGVIRPVSPRRNPGSFDFRRYFQSRGIVGRMSGVSESQVEVLGKADGYVRRRIGWEVRKHIVESVRSTLGKEKGALLEGLLLGRRRALDEQTREQFVSAGLAHVLATSGLHVGIVAAIFVLVGRLMRMSTRLSFLMGAMGSFVFVEASGARAPAMRAFYAVSVLALAKLVGREVKPSSVVAITLLMTLIDKPLSVFDPGFALSFAAVGGILIFVSGTRTLIEKWIVSPFRVSLGATLATLPLTAMYFSRVATMAPVVNLFALPVVGGAVVLGLASTALYGIAPWVSNRLAGANWLFLGALELISKFMSSLPFSSCWVSREEAMLMAVLTGVAFAAKILKRRAAWIMALCFLAPLVLIVVSGHEGEAKIDFLDVGQGDSAVISLPGDFEIVVDGGVLSDGYDSGKEILVPFMRREGVDNVELAIVTHCDADHIGGMYSLVRKLEVQKAALPWLAETDSRYHTFIQLCDSCGTEVIYASEGDTICRGDEWSLTALWPSHGIAESMSANDHSLVTMLEYRGKRILLTGDIEHETEKMLVLTGRSLRCDLLKVPHHGSISSSTPTFLDAMRPSVAVVSVSSTNNFGQPSPLVIERYRNIGTLVLTTARSGAVEVDLSGYGLEVEAMLAKKLHHDGPKQWLIAKILKCVLTRRCYEPLTGPPVIQS